MIIATGRQKYIFLRKETKYKWELTIEIIPPKRVSILWYWHCFAGSCNPQWRHAQKRDPLFSAPQSAIAAAAHEDCAKSRKSNRRRGKIAFRCGSDSLNHNKWIPWSLNTTHRQRFRTRRKWATLACSKIAAVAASRWARPSCWWPGARFTNC